MCNGAAILNQFKNMASGDTAAIVDNLTREVMVIALESPEDLKVIKQIYEAGKCAKKVADESGLFEEQENADEANDESDQTFWEEFNTVNDAASAEAAAKAAAACADNVDRYRAGKIMGRLSAKFFATELKPNV